MTQPYQVAYGGVSVYGGDAPATMLAPGTHLVMGGGIDYDPPPDTDRCHQRKDDGEFCQRYPKKGSLYCPLHKRSEEAIDFINDALGE